MRIEVHHMIVLFLLILIAIPSIRHRQNALEVLYDENVYTFSNAADLFEKGYTSYAAEGDTDLMRKAEFMVDELQYKIDNELSHPGFVVFKPKDTTGDIVVVVPDHSDYNTLNYYLLGDFSPTGSHLQNYMLVKHKLYDSDTRYKINIVGDKLAHMLQIQLKDDPSLGKVSFTKNPPKSVLDKTLCFFDLLPWCP